MTSVTVHFQVQVLSSFTMAETISVANALFLYLPSDQQHLLGVIDAHFKLLLDVDQRE